MNVLIIVLAVIIVVLILWQWRHQRLLSLRARLMREALRNRDFTFRLPADRLFPGERDHEKSMSNNTILGALDRMGYKGRMTGHGFRGVASTLLHEMGFDHAHIELQLAHQERNEVSAAYNHATYLQQRAKMMQHWADYLDSCTTGKVLAFERAAA